MKSFLSRHPALRDALLWAIPALLVGAVLRALLLSYLPYAHWGSDSKSYYSFAHKLLTDGDISLGHKRRFLYPLLLVPVSLLPGAPLRNLAWLQHALGLATVLPLAYVLRKTLVFWRLWIVPVTLLFAGLPIFLWYEHELLGEAFFYCTLVWAFAGWVAWIGADRAARAARLFWLCYVPLAAFLLTKASGRFVLPGLCVGGVLCAAWRRLTWRQCAALAALVLATLGVGSREQGAWLFYTATFPLTQLDTPRHAAHKAQIRDLVEPLRARLDAYYEMDDGPFAFLESPDRDPSRPLWAALEGDSSRKARLYMDLATEAIRAEPLLFLYLGAQRTVVSANMSVFKESKFSSAVEVRRLEDDYRVALADEARGRRSYIHRAFGFGKGERLPAWEQFHPRLVPRPDSWMEHALARYVRGYEQALDLTRFPPVARPERGIHHAKVLPLGWWMLAALPLALLGAYRRTLGVWMLVALSYTAGVFLVSQMNPRYFAPAWPILLALLAIPADTLARALAALWRKLAGPSQPGARQQ